MVCRLSKKLTVLVDLHALVQPKLLIKGTGTRFFAPRLDAHIIKHCIALFFDHELYLPLKFLKVGYTTSCHVNAH